MTPAGRLATMLCVCSVVVAAGERASAQVSTRPSEAELDIAIRLIASPTITDEVARVFETNDLRIQVLSRWLEYCGRRPMAGPGTPREQLAQCLDSVEREVALEVRSVNAAYGECIVGLNAGPRAALDSVQALHRRWERALLEHANRYGSSASGMQDRARQEATLLKDADVVADLLSGWKEFRQSSAFEEMCRKVGDGTSEGPARTVAEVCRSGSADAEQLVKVLKGAAEAIVGTATACLDKRLPELLSRVEGFAATLAKAAPPGGSTTPGTELRIEDLLARQSQEIAAAKRILRDPASRVGLLPLATAPQQPRSAPISVLTTLDILYPTFGQEPSVRLRAFVDNLPENSRRRLQALVGGDEVFRRGEATSTLLDRLGEEKKRAVLDRLVAGGIVVIDADCQSKLPAVRLRRRSQDGESLQLSVEVRPVPAGASAENCSDPGGFVPTGLGITLTFRPPQLTEGQNWDQTISMALKDQALAQAAVMVDEREWQGFLAVMGASIPPGLVTVPHMVTTGIQADVLGTCLQFAWRPVVSVPGCKVVLLDSGAPSATVQTIREAVNARLEELRSEIYAKVGEDLARAGMKGDPEGWGAVSFRDARVSWSPSGIQAVIVLDERSPLAKLEIELTPSGQIAAVNSWPNPAFWIPASSWLTVAAILPGSDRTASMDLVIRSQTRVVGLIRNAIRRADRLESQSVGPLCWAGAQISAARATVGIDQVTLELTGVRIDWPAALGDVVVDRVTISPEANGDLKWTVGDPAALAAEVDRRLHAGGELPTDVHVVEVALASGGMSVRVDGVSEALGSRLQAVLANLNSDLAARMASALSGAQLSLDQLRSLVDQKIAAIVAATGYRAEVESSDDRVIHLSLVAQQDSRLPSIRRLSVTSDGFDFSQVQLEPADGLCALVTSALPGTFFKLSNCSTGAATRDGVQLTVDVSLVPFAGAPPIAVPISVVWQPEGVSADAGTFQARLKTLAIEAVLAASVPRSVSAGPLNAEIQRLSLDSSRHTLVLTGRTQFERFSVPVKIEVPLDGGSPSFTASPPDVNSLLGELFGAVGFAQLGGLVSLTRPPELRPADGMPRELVIMTRVKLDFIKYDLDLPPLVVDQSGVRFERPVSVAIPIGGPYLAGPISFDRNIVVISQNGLGLETKVSVAALTSVFHVLAKVDIDPKQPLRVSARGSIILFEVLPVGDSNVIADVSKPDLQSQLQIGGVLSSIISINATTSLKKDGGGYLLIADGNGRLFTLPLAGARIDFHREGLNAEGQLTLPFTEWKATAFVPASQPGAATLKTGGSFSVGGYPIANAVLRAGPHWAAIRFDVIGMRLGLTLPAIQEMTPDRLLELIRNALAPDLRFDEMVKQVLNGNLHIDPFSRFGPSGGDEGGSADSRGGGGAEGGGSTDANGAGGTFGGGAMSVATAGEGEAHMARAVGEGPAKDATSATPTAPPAPGSTGATDPAPSASVPVPGGVEATGGTANGPLDEKGNTRFDFAQEGSSLLMYAQTGSAPKERRQVVWTDLASGGTDVSRHFAKSDFWRPAGQALTSNRGFFSQALTTDGQTYPCPAPEKPSEIWWYVERDGKPAKFGWNAAAAKVCSGTVDKWVQGAKGPVFKALTAFVNRVGDDLRRADVDLSRVVVRQLSDVAAIWYPRSGMSGVFRLLLAGRSERELEVADPEAFLAESAALKIDPLLRWADTQEVSEVRSLADANGAVLAFAKVDSQSVVVFQGVDDKVRAIAPFNKSASLPLHQTAATSGQTTAEWVGAVRGEMLAALQSSQSAKVLALGPSGVVVQTSDTDFWGAIGEGCMAGTRSDMGRFRQRLLAETKAPTGENRLQGTCPSGAGDPCMLSALQRIVEAPRATVRPPDQIELGLLLCRAAHK